MSSDSEPAASADTAGAVTDVEQIAALKMQRPQGQHDDLARLSRTGSGQSGDRRPPAARLTQAAHR